MNFDSLYQDNKKFDKETLGDEVRKTAHNEIIRATRIKYPLAIAIIDIDNFKAINDTYGQKTGDQVLVECEYIFKKIIREIDTVIHLDGDEYVLFLPGASVEHAYVVVERIRLAISAQPLDLNGQPVSITISSGIANLSDDQESYEPLLDQAEKALYHAKGAGRNRVVGFDDM